MGPCDPDLVTQDSPSLWGSLTEFPICVCSKALTKGGRWTHPVVFCQVETFK